MIKLIRENLIGSILLSASIIIPIIIFFFTETVTITGTVIEHNVVADKQGVAHYYTLVRYKEKIKSEQGLEFYLVPVGQKVNKQELRFK